ncbi:MAG TPA: hypothetical protein VKX96_16440, partial [Chloroflexota bacterium]|nr:hypothetical protein [Chloroflexota bacterium]
RLFDADTLSFTLAIAAAGLFQRGNPRVQEGAESEQYLALSVTHMREELRRQARKEQARQIGHRCTGRAPLAGGFTG